MRHEYKIDVANQSYIQAIATHNSEADIVVFNAVNFRDRKLKAKDLPKLLADKKGIITVHLETYRNSSTFGIFPRLYNLEIALDETIIAEEDLRIAQQMVPKVRFKLDEYLSRGGRDIGLSSRVRCRLSAMQAFIVVRELHRDLHFSAALHFPFINMIFFRYEQDDYYLFYGNYVKLHQDRSFRLDIDDGFSYGNHFNSFNAVTLLNEHFLIWKTNQYKGKLIPDEAAGFRLQQHNASQEEKAPENLHQKKRLSFLLKEELHFFIAAIRKAHPFKLHGGWGTKIKLKDLYGYAVATRVPRGIADVFNTVTKAIEKDTLDLNTFGATLDEIKQLIQHKRVATYNPQGWSFLNLFSRDPRTSKLYEDFYEIAHNLQNTYCMKKVFESCKPTHEDLFGNSDLTGIIESYYQEEQRAETSLDSLPRMRER